jgi:hypothetical protein
VISVEKTPLRSECGRLGLAIAAAAVAVIASVCALGACGHAATETPLANRNAAPPMTGVRAIDWRNRTYELEAIGPIMVKDGRADFALDDDGKIVAKGDARDSVASGDTPGSFRVESPLFADIDGDGSEDAVVSSVLGTGGTGQFSAVTIYTVRDGKVVAVAEIPGGDRGSGGVRHVALDGRAVIVERNVLAEGDGACCASTFQRERWVWRDGQIVEDTAVRGPLLPVPANR